MSYVMYFIQEFFEAYIIPLHHTQLDLVICWLVLVHQPLMVSFVTPKRNEMIVAVNINHLVVMSVIVNDNVSFHNLIFDCLKILPINLAV